MGACGHVPHLQHVPLRAFRHSPLHSKIKQAKRSSVWDNFDRKGDEVICLFSIGKISPDRMNRIRPEGTYFPDNDRRSIHYPTYYMATFQHEKNVTQYVFL